MQIGFCTVARSDWEPTYSFTYLVDCVEGIHRLMRSDFPGPLNLGTDRLVTINELVDLIAEAAGNEITKEHDLSKPQGVRGRNSNNRRLREVLGWEPEVSLEKGIARTYRWIEGQMTDRTDASVGLGAASPGS